MGSHTVRRPFRPQIAKNTRRAEIRYVNHVGRHYRWLTLSEDISYMKAPDSVKLIPQAAWDKHATFWSLAALSYPTYRKQVLQEPKESPIKKEKLHPDEHLMCIGSYLFIYFYPRDSNWSTYTDYMYYLCAFRVSWFISWSLQAWFWLCLSVLWVYHRL